MYFDRLLVDYTGVTSPDNLFKFTSSLSADYFFAPSAPMLQELVGGEAGVELPPHEGVTVRNKRRR